MKQWLVSCVYQATCTVQTPAILCLLQVLHPAPVGVRLCQCQNPAASGGLLPRSDAAAPPLTLRGWEGGRLCAPRETEDPGSAARRETWYKRSHSLENLFSFITDFQREMLSALLARADWSHLTELHVKQRCIILAILFTLCSFVAADQEGEEEEDEEDEGDEEDEDDDNDEEDEAEEKNLKKMEEQRSQGKVRGCLKAFLFLFCRPFILSALSLSVPASQSDARKDESRGPSAPGAGGKGRGETSRNHDDEEEREVPLRQDYVRKEAKNPRGLFKLFFFLSSTLSGFV